MVKFFFFFLTLKIILSKICDEGDIGKIYSSCKDGFKTRIYIFEKVYFYWENQCEQKDLMLPLPILNISCDLVCQRDYYLGYDRGNIDCLPCPLNTFSTGGKFSIYGQSKEWNNESLSYFQQNCFLSLENSTEMKNQNCTGWNISTTGSELISGSTNITNSSLYSELVYKVYLTRNGYVKYSFEFKIEFSYEKDTDHLPDSENGRFQFLVDYEIILNNVDTKKEKKIARFDLKKGYHVMLWQYGFYNDVKYTLEKNLYAKIHYIVIDGIEENQYGCEKCKNNSTKHYELCKNCDVNQFFDENIKKCFSCPENTYSYPNSIGVSNCLNMSLCSDEDYFPIYGKCENGKATLSYSLKSKFCKENETKIKNKTINCLVCNEGMKYVNVDRKNQCEKCEIGTFSNIKTLENNLKECKSCSENEYTPLIKKYDSNNFHEKFKNDFINNCYSKVLNGCFNKNGFSLGEDKLFSGKNLLPSIELDLGLKTKIVDIIGSINFEISLNLDNNEKLLFYINDKIETEFTTSGEYNKTVSLSVETYYFKWKYVRTNSSNSENAVSIKSITIQGVDNGLRIFCSACPEGTIIDNLGKEKKCEYCKNGLVPNKQKNACVSMSEVTYNDSKIITKINSCPVFTKLSVQKDKCFLLDFIQDRFLLKRFHTELLDQIHNYQCNQEEILCYKRFISKEIHFQDNTKYTLYLSPKHSSKLRIKALNEDKFIKTNDHGHVFWVQNDYSKILNLGKTIEYVKFFEGFNKSGLLVKYYGGDKCLNNPNTIYQTYLFINCEKNIDSVIPEMLGLVDKDCTFILEMKNKIGCKSCLKNDVIIKKSVCINSTRILDYEEKRDCIISDVTYPLLNVTTTDSKFTNYITKENVLNDSALSFYFDISKDFNFNYNQISSDSNKPDDYYYVKSKFEIESCSETILNNLDDDSKDQIYIIAFVYLITLIVLIYLICKNAELKNKANMGFNQNVTSNVSHTIGHGNQQLELVSDDS